MRTTQQERLALLAIALGVLLTAWMDAEDQKLMEAKAEMASRGDEQEAAAYLSFMLGERGIDRCGCVEAAHAAWTAQRRAE
jgi:hypothetical protein